MNEVIYTGLEAASNEGYKEILVPTIRMGVMAGMVEKTEKETIEKTALGLNNFLNKYSQQTKLQEINFVVYHNSELAKKLNHELAN